jgi:hypothetical protein
MVTYYKGGKNIVFKLKDTIVEEEVTIWEAWDKKGTVGATYSCDGTPMKFPIKDDTVALKAVTGAVYVLSQLKMKSNKEIAVLFPNLKLDRTYRRTILIGGLEYMHRFKWSVEKQIQTVIALNAGQLPAAYLKQSNFPNEIATKQYVLSVVNEPDAKRWEAENLGGNTAAAAAIGTPVIQPNITIDIPKEDSGMSGFEQAFIDGVKAMPTKLAKDVFMKAFLANAAKNNEIPNYTTKGIDVQVRAEVLFNTKYN